jgi:hypothetical protein
MRLGSIAVGSVERVFVSYHQCVIGAGDGSGSEFGLYTVGDGLLHLTGRSELTVMTGPHTGWVEVGVEVLTSPPGMDPDEWDAVSQATIWCPDGRIAVCGLMGECPGRFRDIPVGRAGLLRVRVRARDRRPEFGAVEPDPDRPERHEVLVWPVGEDTGHATRRDDGLAGSDWPNKFGQAATSALTRLAATANPDPLEQNLRRMAAVARSGSVPEPVEDGSVESTTAVATVRRSRTLPAETVAAVLRDPAGRFGLDADGTDLVLPAGDVAVRLTLRRPPDGTAFAAQWRWTAAGLRSVRIPDVRPSAVEVHAEAGERLVVTHRGVAAPHAVLVGLIWDHLLERVATGDTAPHPWIAVFAARAAEAAARDEATRRRREQREALRWGGRPPTERLRHVAANTIALSRMDRPLLDALAEVTPEQQRAIARWGARRAYSIAGLADIAWIAPALAALDRGEPLPPPFDDDQTAWQRLWSDPQVPQTVVTTPDGTPNFSQQALAFPTLTLAQADDPLAAAVDAIAAAMFTAGPDFGDVAAAARAAFPVLGSAAG